jgi:hypothetical protein
MRQIIVTVRKRPGARDGVMEELRGQAETAVRVAGHGFAGGRAEPAIPILASPSWRGVDGAPWRVQSADGSQTAFVKIMHDDIAAHVDVPCAFEAARRAGEAGIGPRVTAISEAERAIAMADLSPASGWRTATLEVLLDEGIRERTVQARAAFHRGDPLPRDASVFDEIHELGRRARAADAPLPEDVVWLETNVAEAGEGIRASGVDLKPAHGDGNVSNLMVGPEGEIRLLDWDLAANRDPFEDIGSFLVEAHAFETEARSSFEMFYGRLDERLFNRAWLYGVADDLRWGLIGALMAATSPRDTLEFLKFANWRFLRCRVAARDPRFSEKLRRV